MLIKLYKRSNLVNVNQNKKKTKPIIYKIHFKQFDTVILQYYIISDLLLSMGDFS